MKRIWFFLFFVFTALVLLSAEADELNRFGVKEQTTLFNRFGIPPALRQYDIALFLHRLSWQLDIMKKDNWQEATKHPALYDTNCSLDNIILIYRFTTDNRKKIYNSCLLYYQPDNDDELSMINSQLTMYSDKLIKSYSMMPYIIYFNRNKIEGELNLLIGISSTWKKNGEINFLFAEELGEIETIDEKTFHQKHKKIYDRQSFKDLKQSVLNKKPIPPITLDAGKNYKIQLPQQLDPNTRKVFLDVLKIYKTLKSGKVKKLLDDMKFEHDEYTKESVEFRFDKKRVYDILIANDGNSEKIDSGTYIMFDEKSRISKWSMGNLFDHVDVSELNSPTIQKIRSQVDGNGVEIYFHPTGFPKIYRTIIKNRLFGRQIEWDENGKVISNIDLDFPQEWKDAPQKSDNSIKK
jgi:hypothetical protein